jgi:peptide chain release factor 1
MSAIRTEENSITSKLREIETRFYEVEKLISDPGVMKEMDRYRELTQEYASLRQIVEAAKAFRALEQETADTKSLIEAEDDPDLLGMAREELAELRERYAKLENEIKLLLVPKDPLDRKNIIMEIRAGTGGDEAALFAADLFRMYSRYAEKQNWTVEIMSSNEIGIGGFKEVNFSIKGDHVYENLRYESGTHRVQRVPETESGGRIHTSAVTVAVLPEAEDTDIQINQEELKIDVFRSSGPGGQSVNTTDSAVRITHLPTGLVVTCQDEKSQHKNKAKALRVLRARLYEQEEKRKQQERAQARKSQIGSGDRSQRIRTYNFPQGRVTDHRVNLTLYQLDAVLQGQLDEIIGTLKLNAREELLQS